MQSFCSDRYKTASPRPRISRRTTYGRDGRQIEQPAQLRVDADTVQDLTRRLDPFQLRAGRRRAILGQGVGGHPALPEDGVQQCQQFLRGRSHRRVDSGRLLDAGEQCLLVGLVRRLPTGEELVGVLPGMLALGTRLSGRMDQPSSDRPEQSNPSRVSSVRGVGTGPPPWPGRTSLQLTSLRGAAGLHHRVEYRVSHLVGNGRDIGVGGIEHQHRSLPPVRESCRGRSDEAGGHLSGRFLDRGIVGCHLSSEFRDRGPCG